MKKQSAKKRPSKKTAGKKTANRRVAILAFIGAGVLLAAILLIIITASRNQVSPEPGVIVGAADVASLLQGIPQQKNVLGQPDAPVTMYEYADLKCPACQKFATTTLPQIINDYVRTGKLRIVFQCQTFVGKKTTPGDSERGARFGLAAGLQNRQWNFVELFYQNQPPEEQQYFTDEFLTRLGNEIAGLDVQKVFSQTDSDAITQEINDYFKAFSAAGFDSVPSFQIGKTGAVAPNLTSKSLDYGVFKNAIDSLL